MSMEMKSQNNDFVSWIGTYHMLALETSHLSYKPGFFAQLVNSVGSIALADICVEMTNEFEAIGYNWNEVIFDEKIGEFLVQWNKKDYQYNK